MPLYVLHPCRADGSSETFVTYDLGTDDEAYARALRVLDEHPSAADVAIWCGEREVGRQCRVSDDSPAVNPRQTRKTPERLRPSKPHPDLL